MKKTLRALRELRRKLARRIRRRDAQVEKYKKTHDAGHAKAARKDARAVRFLRNQVNKMLRRKHRIEAAHRDGVDWAFGNISAATLKANGKTFVCRYLSHDPSKNLSPAEAKRLSAGGIDILVVWEDSGSGASSGYSMGTADAKAAYAQARACGMPHDRPIFFAVDFDASGPEILDYFKGVATILGKKGAGIYAGRTAVTYILDRKIVDYAWQTYAWSNHIWDHRAGVRQVLIDLPGAPLSLGGVAVDYDKSVTVDFGQWKVA